MKAAVRKVAQSERPPLSEEHARLIHRYVVDFFRRSASETDQAPDALRWTPWADPQTHVEKRSVHPRR